MDRVEGQNITFVRSLKFVIIVDYVPQLFVYVCGYTTYVGVCVFIHVYGCELTLGMPMCIYVCVHIGTETFALE